MTTLKTKSLADLQTMLQDFLLDKTQTADDLTLETPAFSRHERLQIYHLAYRLRLIDALRSDYPALEFYLGEADFVALANEFVATHPSHHPSLRWFGEKIPTFLRAHSYWQTHIHILELAEFEWAQTMAFDAADISVATLDDVRALHAEQWMTMQIEFHPSLQRLGCYSNAPTLWNSLIKDETAIAVDTSGEAQEWLVWREDLQVVYRPLDNSESWALDNFVQQKNFSEICGGLCEWFVEEQVPMQAAQYLQHWIRGGLVAKIIAQ
jgi:hypothetical protein